MVRMFSRLHRAFKRITNNKGDIPGHPSLAPDEEEEVGGIINASIESFFGSDHLTLGEGGEDPEQASLCGDHECTADFFSSNVNLLKTILGAGILAMPSAFATVGWVMGTVFLGMTAGFSAFSLYLLILCSQYIGRGANFHKLSQLTYPRLTLLFDIAVAVKCFGVSVSYLIVIGDMMPSILLGLGFSHAILLSRPFWLVVFILGMAPLAFLRRIDSLKYTSFVGLLGVVYLVILSIWNCLKPGAFRPPREDAMRPFTGFSLKALEKFSVFVFSFTCHVNVKL